MHILSLCMRVATLYRKVLFEQLKFENVSHNSFGSAVSSDLFRSLTGVGFLKYLIICRIYMQDFHDFCPPPVAQHDCILTTLETGF